MDTVTHALTGAIIGYCGFRQRPDGGRTALWASIAAAEFPDVDVLLGFFGNETLLRWHRSFTHSALLLPFWALLVAGAFAAVSNGKSIRLLYAAAAAAIASHLVLDWLTNYGTELLWPLMDTRFALDWVFIVDVYVWAILGVGLIACIVTQRATVARATLVVVGAFFVFCGSSRAVALHRARESAPPLARVDAFPQPMDPLRWTILRDDGATIHWINGGQNDTFTQYHDDQLLPKAEATEAVKLFRWFAAVPLVERIDENGHVVLRYRDLRFRSPMPWGGVRESLFVVAKVVFDKHGNVASSRLTSEGE
ncbi:MAG TPA: metal-dependent hydrolase [Verrucomicrobiae bacterium]|nr:metal-dependent hydrolase [Verrucomicrobiae bacterium]